MKLLLMYLHLLYSRLAELQSVWPALSSLPHCYGDSTFYDLILVVM